MATTTDVAARTVDPSAGQGPPADRSTCGPAHMRAVGPGVGPGQEDILDDCLSLEIVTRRQAGPGRPVTSVVVVARVSVADLELWFG